MPIIRKRSTAAGTRERLLEDLAARIGDERVLAAIAAVPRDRFVAPDFRRRAWHNESLPFAEGQTISQPLVVARMCELLDSDTAGAGARVRRDSLRSEHRKPPWIR